MPWSNQSGGGGPWGAPPGGGGQNPWGRGTGGGGGGPQPPDLEEWIRKGQDQFRRMMPGGMGGGKGIIAILGILLLVWFASGFYRVQADEQGVVTRFGEWVRTEPPGLRYHLPYPIETAQTPKVTRSNRIEVGFNTGTGTTRNVPEESLMLTGDENIIDIDFVVLWRIKDAGQFLFKIRDPEGTVKKAAESAMREVIGRTDIQPALTEARQMIENDTIDLLQTMLDDYESGVEVRGVELQKVDPPGDVIDAFNDVQRARADRERLRNEAEAFRNDLIPRARGNAERLMQEAAAYREEVVNRARGEAQRFISVYEAYEVAQDVTSRRIYIETLEEVFGNTRKVIIDSGNGQGQGVVPYLPLNELQRNQRTSAEGASASGQLNSGN